MDPTLHFAGRLFIAALLAAAAGHKLGDRAAFRDTLASYDLVPLAQARRIASVLPIIELLVATALLLWPKQPAAAWAAATLFASYGAAIAINLHRGRTEIDCGCLGAAGPAPLGADLLVRNGILIAIALATAIEPGDRSVSLLDGVAVVGAVTTAGLLLLGYETARANHRRLRALRQA